MTLQKRVAIVEDDPACASECSAKLSEAGWACVVFARAADALEAARAGTLPRFVLMDLPGEAAFDAIAELRRVGGASIVAFTTRDGDEHVFRAIRGGAIGYVLKHDEGMPLREVLSIVEAGGAPISRVIARRILESLHEPSKPLEAMTRRERDVLALLSRGLTYVEVARSLGISVNTVRTYVRRSYEKLNAATKAEAVAIALRRGALS